MTAAFPRYLRYLHAYYSRKAGGREEVEVICERRKSEEVKERLSTLVKAPCDLDIAVDAELALLNTSTDGKRALYCLQDETEELMVLEADSNGGWEVLVKWPLTFDESIARAVLSGQAAAWRA